MSLIQSLTRVVKRSSPPSVPAAPAVSDNSSSPCSYWLQNGLVTFLSLGIMAIKSVIDAQLLITLDKQSALAFGFAFSLLIAVNVVTGALSAMVTATISKVEWVNERCVDYSVLLLLLLVSALLGGLLIAGMNEALPWIVYLLGAQAFQVQLEIFCVSLYLWAPFNFLLSTLVSVARAAGVFKSSGMIVTVSGVVGIVLSYSLLHGNLAISSLVLINGSNGAAALLSIVGLVILLVKRLKFSRLLSIKTWLSHTVVQMGKVFTHSIAVNLCTLIFIVSLTRLLAQQSDAVLEALAFMTRLEQVVMILFAAFIAVIIPQAGHLVRKKDYDQVEDLLRAAEKFLLISGGSIFVCLLIGLFCITTLIQTDIDAAILRMSHFWFLGFIVQGASILYLQVLAIIVAPSAASMINIFRFLLLGTPLIFLAEKYAGFNGIMMALPLIQLISWLAIRWRFTRLWRRFSQTAV